MQLERSIDMADEMYKSVYLTWNNEDEVDHGLSDTNLPTRDAGVEQNYSLYS